jgi:hypothetical protein
VQRFCGFLLSLLEYQQDRAHPNLITDMGQLPLMDLLQANQNLIHMQLSSKELPNMNLHIYREYI